MVVTGRLMAATFGRPSKVAGRFLRVVGLASCLVLAVSAAARADWGPPRPVPHAGGRGVVFALAISERGDVAIGYSVPPAAADDAYVAYVIVRNPGGAWSAPYHLNDRKHPNETVELAFDAHGNLTLFWSTRATTYAFERRLEITVASKPARGSW